jgi:hypothetical protein
MTEESSPAADLLRLATAYQASATLHAAVRLGIADALDPAGTSMPPRLGACCAHWWRLA